MAQKSTFEKRKDLLEDDYINGVVGVDGKIAIRPLNQEEKEFLEKFNNEYVNANASGKKGEIHYELIKKSKRKVSKIKKEIKEISTELRVINNGYREMNSEQREAYKAKRKALIARKTLLVGRLEEIDVLGNIRRNNYARSCDISNFKKFVSNISDVSYKTFHKITKEANENVPSLNLTSKYVNKTSNESELFELLESEAN